MQQLLENLPRSVIGVGEELARDDPDLDHFQGHIIGKIRPSELLGFIVVVRHHLLSYLLLLLYFSYLIFYCCSTYTLPLFIEVTCDRFTCHSRLEILYERPSQKCVILPKIADLGLYIEQCMEICFP